ncbi:DNA repair protein RecO [Candidatus Uhrbacteria bacterium CG_4_9_14_3_um_filter_36_7]|uniref:DNA repair protein RecO n=1 Tax=Candidatus Uhrbacteria bacterium CG_4_9_14_3_um_filter_36_7 TaxID=1975033 RepID=A0A2M7XIF8_9BACT|nr:MAG: DNA repair protein RecO [Candidatus Uhrbacteria bacterium CG_4_9_14_3_um_filter_36_7]
MATLSIVHGIVLGKRDWREADRIYTVYTETFGKIELLGRGARKPLAKLAPHLELLSEADFLIVHGMVYETIAGVENKQTFSGIYEDVSKMLLTSQTLSAFNQLTRPKQHDEELYLFLKHWLDFLHTCPSLRPERANFILSAFLLKITTILGHRPEVFFV